MKQVEPWSVCPKLTADRLQILAMEAVRVRAEAALEHRPELGDTPWSHGCRCYSRTCYAYESLALSGKYPWLVVEREGLGFLLKIDGEPIRFFHGDAEQPSQRSLQRGISDLINQGRFSFLDDHLAGNDDEWFWRLAIATAADGSVVRVSILQANPKFELRNLWDIPLQAPLAAVASVTNIRRAGVELPPPPVGPKKLDVRRVSSEDGDDDGDGT